MMKPKPSRRAGSAPTISDVAKRAGVSPMTVSRVINGESNVRPTTREVVNAAISALNYAPNPAARSLAGAGQTRIGLLYSNPSAGFLSEFLLGSLDQASRNDVQIVVEKCELGEHELEVTRHLIEGGIDGVVLPPPLCEADAVLELLAAANIPTVTVATGRAPDDLLAIRIDDREAALTMMRHIMQLGHSRIGFITGNPNLSASARRLEGYSAALEEAGIAVDQALIAHGLFTYRSGLDAAEQLLELDDPPSAIFASNDDMAAATVAVAHRRGLDVPSDLTVCGFDDTTLSTAIWPELTTIHQPIADMSRAAVELLVTTIRRQKAGDMTERHRTLDYTLIRRQSDAAPRKRPRSR
ncbi:LacI family DNA-binding transcriptional regulator [Microvirga sp. SRT01]|jgi:LacI family transcriptional regulator|uniref:LacI family DNA-binding transcriptional regulator n=2 Tax=Sphingomonas longa TaxID=2778730 RepID=A0ABS2D456_9SPHN|nr:LacI family DNA-binding transcriptional regulator [Microvirga sp. SRT01]MBM6575689.1 LacI family DNA-binding transcriptional regulator [Sphingomonas sp. BT552]MBR7708736.1 LacI family DNA-binding transcriptional regulator [Microvirga sp. SRT01]